MTAEEETMPLLGRIQDGMEILTDQNIAEDVLLPTHVLHLEKHDPQSHFSAPEARFRRSKTRSKVMI